MGKQPGFFDLENRQAKLLKTKGFLEKVSLYVKWDVFRPTLDEALTRKSSGKGGRPAYMLTGNPILLFRILVIQALYNLSDARTIWLFL